MRQIQEKRKCNTSWFQSIVTKIRNNNGSLRLWYVIIGFFLKKITNIDVSKNILIKEKP